MAGGLPVGVQVLGRPPVAASMGLARALEVAGADSLWAIDHWMWLVPLGLWDRKLFPAARVIGNPEANFDTFAFLGALAQRTRRARLGTAVTEPIRRHPAQLAQASLTIHHLTRGRFVLGIGAGERENVEPYGLSYAGQVSRLEEALYCIRLLWNSPRDYVSFSGRYHSLDRAVIGLGAYRGTFPPIWVAAHGPKMLRLAGRYGDGWLPTHQMEPDEYADHLREIRRAAEEAGRAMRGFTPSYEARVLLAGSHDEAHRLLDSNALRLGALVIPASVWRKAGASHPYGEDYRGVADYVPSRLDPDEVRSAMREVPFEVIHRAIDHGTPEQLAARALSYRAVGLRHLVIQNVTPLADPAKTISSFRAVARLIRSLRRT
ncbi:MAG: LLM class flavin-dependent oxidoreductase [Actinobacteria bacterium]|nr:LLM class flavin-dependent oxidoreductase [Actinomycetota bacterium]